MPRPIRHPVDGMLDAARALVLEGGVRAVTVEKVMARTGAPKGSIYHRFRGADGLLAATWLRAAHRSQDGVVRACTSPGDALDAAVAAGLAVHDFAVTHPEDARLLAAVRPHDLVALLDDPALAARWAHVNDPLQDALGDLARRLLGVDHAAVEAVTCAVVDLPHGAVRRHLSANRAIPPHVRPQVSAAIRAALSVPLGPHLPRATATA